MYWRPIFVCVQLSRFDMSQRTHSTVSIPLGGSLSTSVIVPTGYNLAGFITPAAMTGAAIALNGSHDNTTFVPVTNGGSTYEITIATNAAKYYSLNTEVTKGLHAVQLVSDDTEVAARTIVLVFTKD